MLYMQIGWVSFFINFTNWEFFKNVSFSDILDFLKITNFGFNKK